MRHEMNATVATAAITGIDAQQVEAEADILFGLPKFFVVGLPDKAVQEARERIRSAISNSGYSFPQTRITVNLAPATLRKEGSLYDLPIALALLSAKGVLGTDDFASRLFVGELALDGSLRPVHGVIAVAHLAREKGFREVFVPVANAKEASLINGIIVRPADSLRSIIRHLTQRSCIIPTPHSPFMSAGPRIPVQIDFHDIRGQEHAKRALEIAAAGGHNVLLSGPPGAGKTLLARTMVTILPPMVQSESLEVTRIYSIAGQLPHDAPLIVSRPFRSPHHSASGVALVGGGAIPRPGEISLAHRGVLFLDEFSEFPRLALEHLRQPLEDGVVSISRASGTYQFPAKFTLVAAMNPCPCGYAGSQDRECTCTSSQIAKYQKRISGPLLDRIDLHIEVPKVPFQKLVDPSGAESSRAILQRVQSARERQQTRLHAHGIVTNAEMSSRLTKTYCSVDQESISLLQRAAATYHFSARSYFRILKVARTIADLAGKDTIRPVHVAEAVQYRTKIE